MFLIISQRECYLKLTRTDKLYGRHALLFVALLRGICRRLKRSCVEMLYQYYLDKNNDSSGHHISGLERQNKAVVVGKSEIPAYQPL